ncbi:chromate resistance protein ChrB domain-containing protein [Methylomonas koyamae]|uniref:chromate resistance protein ChrB domain-containing protein n=1 Tax=Methylomonas koyamae TaxID=702114 RepID=UPI002872E7B2|nr:chromate resistance protein ChrB domain-containing protein [Methylomonas koyamae]WNB77441.1 chromate resistance protein [Methylomonas koyamae]
MAYIFRVSAVFLLCIQLSGCDLSASENKLIFVTRPGMGIDKWASIWLIKRHIAAGADVLWLADNEDTTDKGILFDTEKSFYKRTGQASAFSALIEGFNIEIAYLPEFLQLVHDVEINYWGPSELIYSDAVENQFRHLQAQFGQEKTPMACYMGFFDNLAAMMPELQNKSIEELNGLNELIPDSSCAEDAQIEKVPRSKLVAEWPIEAVLKALQQRQNIVFLDVREPEEFAEAHIPGAINVQIRDLPGFDLNSINSADLVIPYCIKDFRGFEMARLLKQHGVANVALLRPYGFKGWKTVGMPTADAKNSESMALKQLTNCANQPHTCLKLENAS